MASLHDHGDVSMKHRCIRSVQQSKTSRYLSGIHAHQGKHCIRHPDHSLLSVLKAGSRLFTAFYA